MSSDGVSVWMPEETSSPKLSCHLTWSYKLALHSNVQMFCSASLSFSRMVVEVVGGLFWWAREGDWMDRNSRLAKIEDVKGWISTNREGVCYDTLPQKKKKKNTTNSSVKKMSFPVSRWGKSLIGPLKGIVHPKLTLHHYSPLCRYKFRKPF